MNASINPFFGRIAALRGARSFVYLIDIALEQTAAAGTAQLPAVSGERVGTLKTRARRAGAGAHRV